MRYYYIRDNERKNSYIISNAYIESMVGITALVALMPFILVIAAAIFFLNVLAKYIIQVGIIFLVLSVVVSLFLACRKYKNWSARIIDALATLMLLLVFDGILFLYLLPLLAENASTNNDAILGGVIMICVYAAIIFMQQCVRRIIRNPLLNFLLCAAIAGGCIEILSLAMA